jgi:hypothetical protein
MMMAHSFILLLHSNNNNNNNNNNIEEITTWQDQEEEEELLLLMLFHHNGCLHRHLWNKNHVKTLRKQYIQSLGFDVTSTPLLSRATVQAVRDRFEPLFRGEFETGLSYPDVQWHSWGRPGIGLPTGGGVQRAQGRSYHCACHFITKTLAAMVCVTS